MNLLKQSDPDALQYLLRIYFPVICRYSEKITLNQVESEDITEEVFIRLWKQHKSFENFIELKRFLYTVARNLSINKRRDKMRELANKAAFTKEYFEDNNANDYEIVFAELLAEIRKSIDFLPTEMRKIFILSYYKKMSNKEIAVHLSLSEQTVRNQKTKALAKLKLLLKPNALTLLLISL